MCCILWQWACSCSRIGNGAGSGFRFAGGPGSYAWKPNVVIVCSASPSDSVWRIVSLGSTQTKMIHLPVILGHAQEVDLVSGKCFELDETQVVKESQFVM